MAEASIVRIGSLAQEYRRSEKITRQNGTRDRGTARYIRVLCISGRRIAQQQGRRIARSSGIVTRREK